MVRKRKKTANFKPFESLTQDSKHLRITENMMKSKAWAMLDTYDITAYIYYKSKYYLCRDDSDNQKNISLTYEEMRSVMSPDRFKKCIDNLVEYGFIDIVKHKPQTREATIFGLSARWHKYGTDEFNEKSRVKYNRRKKES